MFSLFYKGGSIESTLHEIKEWTIAGNTLNQNSYIGLSALAQAESAYLTCNWNQSEIILQRTWRQCLAKGNWSTHILLLYLDAQLAYTHGSYAGVEDSLEQMRSLVAQNCPPNAQLFKTVDICESHFKAMMGRDEDAAPWLLDDISLDWQDQMFRPSLPFAYTTYEQLLLCSGKYSSLIAMEDILNSLVERYSLVITYIYHSIYISSAYYSMGFDSKAIEHLDNAMKKAAPQSIFMPFVENNRLLSWADDYLDSAWSSIRSDMRPFIDKFNSSAGKVNRQSFKPRNTGLSEREYEIALLAAKGSTNDEISAKLKISVNTVKASMKVIFRKLDIVSRKELPDIILPINNTGNELNI